MLKVSRVHEAVGKTFWLGLAIFATSFFAVSAHAVPENTTLKQNSKARFSVGVDTVLDVRIPDRLDFEIRSDGILHYAEFNIGVSTNHVTGYTAYASVPVTDFVNTTNSETIVPTIPVAAPDLTEDFPQNSWGLKFPAINNDTFLPAATGMLVETIDEPVQDHTITTVIGARIDGDTPSGHYLCTINFEIVPNIIPDTIRSISFMQQMSPEVAASMQEDVSYQLHDNRDNKTYWIIKHDGQIVMQQNLDLELTNDIVEGVPNYTILRPASSDVTEERTMTLVEPWAASASDIYYYRSADDLYYPDGYKTPAETDDLSPYSEDLKFSAGSYYSWNSATAGTGANVAAADTQAAESICPKGWRLPKANEGNLLVQDDTIVRSGHFDNTTGNVVGVFDGADITTGALYVWTSSTGTTTNDVKYIKIAGNTATIEEGSRVDGFSVRCVADPPNEFSLTYNANGGSNAPAGIERVSWEENIETTLPFGADAPTLSGKNLIGWARTADAKNPEFSSNESVFVVMPGEPVTLYAVWRTPCNPSATTISAAVCMQDVNSSVASSMTADTGYQLMDYRDGKIYWVTKHNDEVWMTQNLDFEIPQKGVTLTTEYSDVTESRTLTIAEDNDIRYNDGGDTYFAGGITPTDATSLIATDTAWHNHIGSFYSWAAASAGVEATDSQSTESICPKGWTLPKATGAQPNQANTLEGFAYVNGSTAMNTTNSTQIAGESGDTLTYKADLNIATLFANPQYITMTGYGTEYGRIILPGGAARIWSSELQDENHAKALMLYRSTDNEQLIQITDNSNIKSQYTVRCVLK